MSDSAVEQQEASGFRATSVRWTDEQHEMVRAAAKAAGFHSVVEFIRTATISESRRVLSEQPATADSTR